MLLLDCQCPVANPMHTVIICDTFRQDDHMTGSFVDSAHCSAQVCGHTFANDLVLPSIMHSFMHSGKHG